MSTTGVASQGDSPPHLKREVGFWGLTFVSLGSIIGSGWLFGALKGASAAGPASTLSWVLAAAMLAVLALIHAELGTAYPFAGGTARYPQLAYGPIAGFAAGWASWLQAVAIAPIEVEATLGYMANISWISHHITLQKADSTLTVQGLLVGTVLMLIFTFINVVGVKLLSETNSVTVIWKTAVPVLTIITLITLSFHGGNFTAGGGFMPYGAHGVFAALPLGIVFALQGFEQAVQMAGEARNPQKDISRAILTAAAVGTVVYLLLEVAFIGSLNPADLAHGWAHPMAKGSFGPYATLATAAGAAWLTWTLYADAVISPAGTGLVYMGTSARLSYALGKEKSLPQALASIWRGVPIGSIALAFVVGEIAFLPFPSWQELVGVITDATAVMYAFAPVALHALRLRDPERRRPYRLPAWRVLSPVGFVSANLIIYWSGWEMAWKLSIAIAAGLVIFAITRALRSDVTTALKWKASAWIWPWWAGIVLFGYLGRYGGKNDLPEWIDLLVVSGFSLVIYYLAVRIALSREEVLEAVAIEESELNLAQAETEAETKAKAEAS